MGSYAYTCALSDLPIEAGDECRIVAMVKSRLGLNGGACSRMELAFPPIKGVYDDYGYVENLSPTPFQERLAESMGYGSVEQFAGKLKEGAVEVAAWRKPYEKAVFSLAREDVWRQMLSMPSELRDEDCNRQDAQVYMGRACLEGAEFFSKAADILAQDKAGSGLVDSILESRIARQQGAALCAEEVSALRSKILMDYCMSDEMDKSPAFKSALGCYFENSIQEIYRGLPLRQVFVGWSLSGASKAKLRDGLLEIGEQMLVNMNMNMLRKVWIERDSSGPQFGEHAMHWLWAQKLGEISKAQVNWNDEENANYVEGFKQAKALMFKEQLEAEIPQGSKVPSSKSL